MQLAQLKLPDNATIDYPQGFRPEFTNLASVVSNAIPFIFPIAGVLLLLYLVWGGFDFLTSMGDAKKVETARGKLTNAIIGFLIIFFAYWIVQILDNVFKLGVYNK
mgnify:CR=1 FL=1